MANPKRAIQALSACVVTVGRVSLRPLNLGHAIVLEQIGCPLIGEDVTPAKVKGLKVLDLLPTAYVLATDPQECLAKLASGRAEFDAAVAAFATGIPAADGKALAIAVLRQFSCVDAVAPQGGPEGNAPAATAGSQP